MRVPRLMPLLVSLVLLATFGGCASSPPTPSADEVFTMAVQTADQLMTQAALAPSVVPSPTPVPTRSPTAVPSNTPPATLLSTPPFFVLLPSPTSTPSQELDCSLIWQSMVDGSKLDPGESFSVSWKVSNTGTSSWNPETVDFTYLSGTRMNQSQVIHLQAAVLPGGAVTLTVDMRAPKKSSDYTTMWSLRRGQEYFCSVGVTISVDNSASES